MISHPNGPRLFTPTDDRPAPQAATNGPGLPFSVHDRVFQHRLIALTDHLLLASGYLPGIHAPSCWSTDTEQCRSTETSLAVQTHGYALLLDDLLPAPEACVAIVAALRDVLQHCTHAAFRSITDDGTDAC